jgi:hypothetical protein
MKKINMRTGTSINKACDEIYDRALHGESLYFNFNGVRISMYPTTKLKE